MTKLIRTVILASTLTLGFGCAHKGHKKCEGKQCDVKKSRECASEKCDMKKKHHHHGEKKCSEKQCDMGKEKKSCCPMKKEEKKS